MVTVTSTVPAACDGALALISESDTTVNEAATDPNDTEEAPVKLLPEMVARILRRQERKSHKPQAPERGKPPPRSRLGLV